MRLQVCIVYNQGDNLLERVAFHVFLVRLDRLLANAFAHKVFAEAVDVFLGVNVADSAHLQALVSVVNIAHGFGAKDAVEGGGHNALAAQRILVEVAVERVGVAGVVPTGYDFVQARCHTHQLRVTRANQREREFDALRERGKSCRNQGEWRFAVVRGELDIHAEAKEHSLAGHDFLVGHAAGVVAAHVCAVAQVSAAFGPKGRNQERVVVHLGHGAHVRAVDFAFFDVAARRDNRRLHDCLAGDCGAAHEYRTLHLGTGVNGDRLLHVRIFENHGIVNVARFFERRKHHGIADFFGTFDACVRTDPAVTNNVCIADHGALAHYAERERSLFAVGLELFVEGCRDFGVRLVEQLCFYKFHGNFGEHGDFTAAHFVAHVHGIPDHVADFSATDDGAHVLDNRAAANQNVAEHGHLMDQCVFDKAIVYKAVVNACRERHVARQ